MIKLDAFGDSDIGSHMIFSPMLRAIATPVTTDKGFRTLNPLPENFEHLENEACDIHAVVGWPIVYTEDYLALKNGVIPQEL